MKAPSHRARRVFPAQAGMYHPNATFNWEEFGIAQGIGGASGLLFYLGGEALGCCCGSPAGDADGVTDGMLFTDDDADDPANNVGA